MEPAEIREIISNATSTIDIIEKISGIKGYMITELGSCQYGTIYSTYYTLSTIYNMLKEEKGYDVLDNSQKIELIKETFQNLGIQIMKLDIDFEKINDQIQELKEKFYSHYGFEDFEENLENDADNGEEEDGEEEDGEDNDYEDFEYSQCKKAYENIKNVDDFLVLSRDSSWDLWTAIPDVADVLLKDFDMMDIPHKLGESRYVLSNLLQGDNYKLGIQIFILLTLGIIKHFDSLSGFDT